MQITLSIMIIMLLTFIFVVSISYFMIHQEGYKILKSSFIEAFQHMKIQGHLTSSMVEDFLFKKFMQIRHAYPLDFYVLDHHCIITIQIRWFMCLCHKTQGFYVGPQNIAGVVVPLVKNSTSSLVSEILYKRRQEWLYLVKELGIQLCTG